MTPHHTPTVARPSWLRRTGVALLFALLGAVGVYWLTIAALLVWLWGPGGVATWNAADWVEDGWRVALTLAAAAGILVGLSWLAGVAGVPLGSTFVGAPLGAAYGYWLQRARERRGTA